MLLVVHPDEHPSMRSGLWVLAGILIFTIVEKIFSGYVNHDDNNPQPKCVNIASCLMKRANGEVPKGETGIHCTQNGSCDIEDVPNGCFLAEKSKQAPTIKIAGYLNLMANSIDNFTHGLAVAGSFLVSFRHGMLGTFAILCKFYFPFNPVSVVICYAIGCSARNTARGR